MTDCCHIPYSGENGNHLSLVGDCEELGMDMKHSLVTNKFKIMKNRLLMNDRLDIIDSLVDNNHRLEWVEYIILWSSIIVIL